MHSRDLNQCVPILREKWLLFKAAASNIWLSVAITCTSRTYQEQIMLYVQGREKLDMVNHLRANCGYSPLSEKQNQKVVTWTLDSKHVIHDERILSEALDFVIINKENAVWDVKADINQDEISDYAQLAQIATDIGLVSGAYFKNKAGKATPDYCHLEVK